MVMKAYRVSLSRTKSTTEAVTLDIGVASKIRVPSSRRPRGLPVEIEATRAEDRRVGVPKPELSTAWSVPGVAGGGARRTRARPADITAALSNTPYLRMLPIASLRSPSSLGKVSG